ncbi:NAD(+) synthase [Chelatococcus asaccharovorans]|uniref:NAD(+) synthase n=1 Tax=Chelatococcus asaccharovorans TaxID=28210 RepID=UPI00224C6B16|nr:NAD(+) synthase [Chelatococcus asaccharovorans]CAH1673504.1 Glutamine-dependent NAD(+) synthetase [Chelatococcus asaccharovorans]CAH1675076.1 Glutamine-dependent NAD(+) synthetase [Chelatococcus asaccharovorans]
MPDFDCMYKHGFLRVAACVPIGRVADPEFAATAILDLAAEGDRRSVAVMLFPELGLSSYAIDDLLLQDALLDAVEQALARIVAASRHLFPVLVVGAPLRHAGRLFNAAVVIHRGTILGAVPKSYLPNYREFYERRHFTAGAGRRGEVTTIAGQTVPFGVDLIFRSEGSIPFVFHVEICEDIWVPLPPSTRAAMAGAELLLNLSASNITIGKAGDRRLLCASQSARCVAAYAYSAAGPGESTTDLAWDGQAAIFENGDALAETDRFARASTYTLADVDLGRLRQERMRMNTFGDCAREEQDDAAPFRAIAFVLDRPPHAVALERIIARFPYVPADPARLREDCYEAYNIQVQGLAQRLAAARMQRTVIGVSGGLDSTQALIVAARAMDLLGLPRSNVLAYTLPGFATSQATRANALALIKALGVSGAEIDIRPAAQQMLADLGHPFARGEAVYDVTFENVQAGLRTDYLFRLANQNGALVVGTGDLSELALGWCTYGVGDHMSHYNVNASVPKTLIQHLIRFVAASGDVSATTVKVLNAILATEISPELVPAAPGAAIQSTQDVVGPYALQDFTLFYLTRYGFPPSKIAFLAERAWGEVERGRWPVDIPEADRRAYSRAEIRRWLVVFLKRFFTSQFKRSALPNGPKISSGGSLSPRGDWRAPSDADAAVWLAELDAALPPEAG